jgi:hypothetical protein
MIRIFGSVMSTVTPDANIPGIGGAAVDRYPQDIGFRDFHVLPSSIFSESASSDSTAGAGQRFGFMYSHSGPSPALASQPTKFQYFRLLIERTILSSLSASDFFITNSRP